MSYFYWLAYRFECAYRFRSKYGFSVCDAWSMAGEMKESFDPEYPTAKEDVDEEIGYWVD